MKEGALIGCRGAHGGVQRRRRFAARSAMHGEARERESMQRGTAGDAPNKQHAGRFPAA